MVQGELRNGLNRGNVVEVAPLISDLLAREVEAFDAELGERLVKRLLHFVVVVVGELSGQKAFFPGHSRFPDSLSDVLLVTVSVRLRHCRKLSRDLSRTTWKTLAVSMCLYPA